MKCSICRTDTGSNNFACGIKRAQTQLMNISLSLSLLRQICERMYISYVCVCFVNIYGCMGSKRTIGQSYVGGLLSTYMFQLVCIGCYMYMIFQSAWICIETKIYSPKTFFYELRCYVISITHTWVCPKEQEIQVAGEGTSECQLFMNYFDYSNSRGYNKMLKRDKKKYFIQLQKYKYSVLIILNYFPILILLFTVSLGVLLLFFTLK